MNRDIKFRAWVKDKKAIFEVVLINYVTKKVTYLFEKSWTFFKYKTREI